MEPAPVLDGVVIVRLVAVANDVDDASELIAPPMDAGWFKVLTK